MNTKRTTLAGLLLGFAVIVAMASATFAQEDLMGGEAELIGGIPGTDMTRDEFRARAQAQLTAIAINAEVFRLVYASYPANFNELRASVAWNLEVDNMFTGQPISWIYYEPQPGDLIPEQDLGFPMVLNFPSQTPDFRPPGGPTGEGDGDAGGDDGTDGGNMLPVNQTPPVPVVMRVDPTRVDNVTPGDVFLYSTEETLQVLIYAPDGTVHELFHNSPNRYWQSQLQVDGAVAYWPEDLFAAQLLFFAEDILPQSYNHVLFMSDHETLPTAQLNSFGIVDRITMAAELGISLLNPYEERMIDVSTEYLAGDFIITNQAIPVPLQICLRGNRISTRQQLLDSQKEAKLKQDGRSKSGTTRPSRPPLGGSR